MFSTLGDVQYIGRCSVDQGDTMSTLGDIMSTLGGVQYIGGYHAACGDIMSTSGMFSTLGGIP